MKEKGKSGEKTVVREHCLRKLKQLGRAQVSQEKKVTEKQEEGVKLDEAQADKQHEEQAEATWTGPLAFGQKVRLTVEDFEHRLSFGDEGVVQACDEKEAVVKFENRWAPVQVPLSLLTRVPQGGFVRSVKLTGLCRLSEEMKVNLLREAGVGDPLVDEVTPWNPELLVDQGIDMFAGVVRQNLSLLQNRKLRYVPTRLSRFLLEDAIEKPAAAGDDEGREVREKRLMCLRRFFEEGELLLVPISAGEHWALLRIWKHKDAETEVEYFESFSDQHEACLRQAQAMLRLLKLNLSDKGLRRKNVAEQSGPLESGHWVTWYLEDGMRAFAGEGQATQGWPSDQMKGHKDRTEQWHATLSKAFGRWRTLRREEAGREAQLRKIQAEAARKSLEAKGLLEKLFEAQGELARSLLRRGAAPEGPPLPSGFGEKPKKMPAVVEASAAGDALSEGGEPLAVSEETAGATAAKSVEAPALEETTAAAEAEEAVPEATKKRKAGNVRLTPILVLTETEQLAVEVCKNVWAVEDLLPEFRASYETVRDHGMGVCGSCRWKTGCMRCDERKAWDYYVRQSLG